MRTSNNNILNLRKKLDNKDISIEELFDNSIKKARFYQDKYNSFVTIIDKYQHKSSNSILNGIPYALKDNISTEGILTTASSNILKNYIPVYDATIYKKLKDAGAILMGKTVLDELAMGGTGTTGHTGIVKNPWDSSRQIGGSSSGSAAAVSLDIVPFAIGSDTGDSIRKPAAYSGVVGFKPTYGRISRYGLFAFASSLDHLGIISRCVEDCAIVSDIVKGHDVNDMTSLEDEDINYFDHLKDDIKNKKLFYIKETCDISNYENPEIIETLNNFYNVIDKYKKLGISIEEVSIDKKLLESLYPTYMCISCAETTSNNANLTGISFGNRIMDDDINNMIIKTRTEGFSELIKRRFIEGSYILQKENQEKLFLNACRIRRLIVDKMNDLFTKYDGMIMPTIGIAPHFEEKTDKLSNQYLLLENHMQIANFGGFPSITIPSGFVSNMPIGINITTKAKNDVLALNLAYKLEEILDYKNMIAKGCDDNV